MAEWLAFGLSALKNGFLFGALGSSDLRWKFVLKKIAMTVKVLYETNLLGEVTD